MTHEEIKEIWINLDQLFDEVRAIKADQARDRAAIADQITSPIFRHIAEMEARYADWSAEKWTKIDDLERRIKRLEKDLSE